jgi:pimeloyl-ACP methyl ester carboxylesterase
VDAHDRHGRHPLPILISNGFAPFPIPLHLVCDRFKAYGFSPHVVGFRLSDMRCVERYARHIAEDARTIRRDAGVRRINLLGFSMGGVAALYALKRLGLAPQVHTFVGLGSPFLGSVASWLALPTAIFSRTGRQLAPNSPFLAELHADGLPPGPRYLTVAGTRDIICPPPTAQLDGAEHYELPIGHAEFIADPTVVDLLAPLLG